MSKPRKDKPLKMPKYRGGDSALKAFITSNLSYPQAAIEHKIEGQVKAQYDVDGLGRTFNIRIMTSLGYGCDEEVIRLIGLLKFEGAFNRGRSVTLHKSLKVDFKLPPSNDLPSRSVNYQVVPEKKTVKEKPGKKDTINYTIKF